MHYRKNRRSHQVGRHDRTVYVCQNSALKPSSRSHRSLVAVVVHSSHAMASCTSCDQMIPCETKVAAVVAVSILLHVVSPAQLSTSNISAAAVRYRLTPLIYTSRLTAAWYHSHGHSFPSATHNFQVTCIRSLYTGLLLANWAEHSVTFAFWVVADPNWLFSRTFQDLIRFYF